jgi:hypothetical protein
VNHNAIAQHLHEREQTIVRTDCVSTLAPRRRADALLENTVPLANLLLVHMPNTSEEFGEDAHGINEGGGKGF